jgi:hypothetical protein
VTLAALAACVYSGVLAYVVARSGRAAPATGALGGLGALVLVALLVRARAALVPWPAALLGVAYAVGLVVRGAHVDGTAPLVAVGLLLCSELAAWSIDERLGIAAERAVLQARAAALGALAFGSLVVAALVVAVAAAPAGFGLAWTIVGAGSAVAVVGLAVRLARRNA